MNKELTLEDLKAALLEAGFIRVKDLTYDLEENKQYKGGYLLNSLCYDYGDGTVIVFRSLDERGALLQECRVSTSRRLACKLSKDKSPRVKHFNSLEQIYDFIFDN